jgi:hypothetical protein
MEQADLNPQLRFSSLPAIDYAIQNRRMPYSNDEIKKDHSFISALQYTVSLHPTDTLAV